MSMYDTLSYAQGAVEKLASYGVNPREFVVHAVRTRDPQLLKVAEVIVAGIRTARRAPGEYVKVANLASDAAKTVVRSMDDIAGSAKATGRKPANLLDWSDIDDFNVRLPGDRPRVEIPGPAPQAPQPVNPATARQARPQAAPQAPPGPPVPPPTQTRAQGSVQAPVPPPRGDVMLGPAPPPPGAAPAGAAQSASWMDRARGAINRGGEAAQNHPYLTGLGVTGGLGSIGAAGYYGAQPADTWQNQLRGFVGLPQQSRFGAMFG